MEPPMTPNTELQEADEALRAACEPLLQRLEALPQLLPLVEPEVLVLLAQARHAGKCSRVAIYRIDGRLKLVRRLALGLASLAPSGPRLG